MINTLYIIEIRFSIRNYLIYPVIETQQLVVLLVGRPHECLLIYLNKALIRTRIKFSLI